MNLNNIVLWALFWAFSTAVIRPLSGESIWAFIERGANWIAPLVLFNLLNNKEMWASFTYLRERRLTRFKKE